MPKIILQEIRQGIHEDDDDFDLSKRMAKSLFNENPPKSWTGPHAGICVNGIEASVLVFITHGILNIQIAGRARQLLIYVTHGKSWNPGSDNYETNVVRMNEAIEKGYMRKVGDTQSTGP